MTLKTNKLIEAGEKLVKIDGHESAEIKKTEIGFSISFDTGMIVYGQDFTNEDAELLAKWIQKNYHISHLPGFKEAVEYEEMRAKLDKYKEVIEDNVDRLKELVDMTKRLMSVISGVIEADQIRKGNMTPEAIIQMVGAVRDAKSILDH